MLIVVRLKIFLFNYANVVQRTGIVLSGMNSEMNSSLESSASRAISHTSYDANSAPIYSHHYPLYHMFARRNTSV